MESSKAIRMSPFTGLVIAVLAVSSASIFIRWVGDVPALVIAFYRMFWTFLILLIYQLTKDGRELKLTKISGNHRLLIFFSGLFLAAHFGTWIASIQNTLISHSLILESTHPVMALILSPIFLKEKGGIKTYIAALITLAGIFLIAAQDFSFSGGNYIGDIQAILAALFFTFYVIIARYLRKEIKIIPYLIFVYGTAAFSVLIFIVLEGLPLFNYSLQVHGLFILLAIIPTGIGHSLINWAARHLPAYQVNFSVLGEPVIASVLAYLFFSELPYGLFYIGAFLIVIGIIVSLY